MQLHTMETTLPGDYSTGSLATIRLKEAFRELNHENALLKNRQQRTQQQLDQLRKVRLGELTSICMLSPLSGRFCSPPCKLHLIPRNGPLFPKRSSIHCAGTPRSYFSNCGVRDLQGTAGRAPRCRPEFSTSAGIVTQSFPSHMSSM